ncbi:3-hydroxyacyl-CoA dehydrogenase NAD-binding domain-containing protein, partial [Acinetobacter baumannii]
MSAGQIQTVGVIGAGQMGSGIAQVAAQAGFDVRMCDVSKEVVDKAKAKIGSILTKQ